MKRAHEDQGFVLITAIILLTVMLGLGIALVAYTNSQQTASAREQFTEKAFNLAEAALNAQISRVSQEWPAATTSYPEKCTSAESSSTNCPESTVIKTAFPNTNDATCTGSEAWGSPLTNEWDTYVRRDEAGASYFNSTAEKTAPRTASTSEKVWVRAVGVVDCHAVTVVSLVSEQSQHPLLPESVISANSFQTGNSGGAKGFIIERKGKTSKQPGKIDVRCKGFTGTEAEIRAKCEEYTKGQINPELVPAEEPLGGSSTTLSTEELEEVKAQAKAEGHFYSPTTKCPTKSVEELSGNPVYIEGCKGLSFTGNGSANVPPAKPGFLVLANGTISFTGTGEFYGVIYAANQENSEGTLVELGGNIKVIGEIIVDGNGSVNAGDSHKGNLEYDPTAAVNFEFISGAAATRNSFRILPSGQ